MVILNNTAALEYNVTQDNVGVNNNAQQISQTLKKTMSKPQTVVFSAWLIDLFFTVISRLLCIDQLRYTFVSKHSFIHSHARSYTESVKV